MHDILRREFARARRSNAKLSCLLIDIDRFKKINERYGHLQGDSVLQRFSNLV
ncbi:MAG TPA: diguanylate cyclase, partial [Bacteroidetes bacterium]|nr:diguanylate cyclase [Bacteroidota bacterium]